MAILSPIQPATPAVARTAASVTVVNNTDLEARGVKRLPPASLSNTDLWAYYRAVPEAAFISEWQRRSISMVKFQAETITGQVLVNPDGTPNQDPEISPRLAAAAVEILARIRGPFGPISSVAAQLALCLEVAGDGWLVGYRANLETMMPDADGPEVWVTVARSRLDRRSDRLVIRVGDGRQDELVLSGGVRAIRVFDPDPEVPLRAVAWMRPAVPVMDTMIDAYESVAAAMLSRLPAGLLVVPNDADVMPGADEATRAHTSPGQSHPDGFADEVSDLLGKALLDAGTNRDAGVRGVPILQGVSSSLVDKFNYVSFARDLDPELVETIREFRQSIAIASPAPPELILGLGEMNRFNKEQITEAEFQQFIKPRAQMIAEAFTAQILRRDLLEMGFTEADAASVRVGFDASELIVPPDRSESARDAYDRGLISREAYLAEIGLEGAPPPDDTEPEPEEPEPELSAPPALPARTAATDDDPDELGMVLAEIAMRYSETLGPLVDQVVNRMIERAANRVRSAARRDSALRNALTDSMSALNVVRTPQAVTMLRAESDEDLLEPELVALLAVFRRTTEQARRRILAAVAASGLPREQLEEQLEDAERDAWELLSALILLVARDRIAGAVHDEEARISDRRERDRAALDDEEEEESDEQRRRRSDLDEGEQPAGFRTPAIVLRRTSAVAGGSPDPGEDSGVADAAVTGGLISTGLIVTDWLRRERELTVTGWEWVYGDPAARRTPFPEHVALDGAVAASRDGFSGGWHPGDHIGCLCVLSPTFT